MAKVSKEDGKSIYSLEELQTILTRVDSLIDRLIPIEIWLEEEPREDYEVEFAKWIHRAAHKQKEMILADIKRLSTH